MRCGPSLSRSREHEPDANISTGGNVRHHYRSAPLRTHCRWNHLPREYSDDASVHRTFQHRSERGIVAHIWAAIKECYEELAGSDCEWQVADTAMGKAWNGGTRSARVPLTAPGMA